MKGIDCIHFGACARLNAACGYGAKFDELCSTEDCMQYIPSGAVISSTLRDIVFDAWWEAQRDHPLGWKLPAERPEQKHPGCVPF